MDKGEIAMELSGLTALVTGGGTGIGRAIVLKLAEKGANVVINYSKSESDAQLVLTEVERLGARGLICKADVSVDAEVREMFGSTLEQFGRVDILINNAGMTRFVDFSDLQGLQDADWEWAFSVNAKAIFLTSRACADELRRNRGCIVNITSVAGLNAQGSSIAYCASKAAAISITKSLARTLAPSVRVNAIAPGIVETRWVAGKEEHIRRFGADTPLGRVASPEDIAEVALSLIVCAGFVTGQTVVVDGGRTM